MRPRRDLLLATCCLLVGCGDDAGGQNQKSTNDTNNNNNQNGSARCGDGTLDPGESCDGSDLGPTTCLSLGYSGGPLACAGDCTFDTRDCAGPPTCGNGAIDLVAGEVCDGTDLGGASCASAGFSGGQVTCLGNCQLDTSGCTTCGDGTCDPGESPVGCPADCHGPLGISAGAHHSCAIRSDQTLFCWGVNAFGQLGDGTTVNRCVPGAVLSSAPPAVLADVVQVAAGGAHTCAVIADGTAFCWGKNASGQLGDDSTTDRWLPTPVEAESGVGVLSGVVGISAGEEHTCAVLATGSVSCWGLNDDGQLGDGTNTDRSVPALVADPSGIGELGDISAVTCAHYHSCGLTATGGAFCWGMNFLGQLGDGTTQWNYRPVAVVGVGGAGLLDEVTVLSAGGSHTCARRVEGGVLCWGDNFTGQLGDGQTHQACTPGDCSPVPVPVAAVGGQGALGDIVDLTAGASGSCAIRGDGTAVCWGQGEVGQLGEVATHPTCSTMVGPIECSPVPVVVSDIGGAGSLQAVTALDSGLSHTCAIHGAGSLVCWGVNEGGELGDGLTHQACAEELGGPLDCSYSPVPTAPLP